jgi:arylsulfatase A-like enzyme/cytochrome c-type biogenesis protein CcmH/NrfG
VSVLLITVDTLRADRLGCYGDARARTPRIDALARDGLRFEAAYTPAPITLPAHASILTGLVPPAHGVRGNGAFALGPGPTTLAEALKARGHRTAAFIGGFPLARRFGLDRGFEHYDDAVEKAPGVHYEFAERRATAVVEAARSWMGSHPGLVFVWVHLFDPHAPYDPPEAFREADPYRGEIAAVDAAFGSLLSAWDARTGPSVVAFTADHGEAFGEHREESHSLFVYDTTLRVPLILRAPGLPRGRRLKEAAGLTDLAATLLELAGGAGPSLPGQSLLGPPRGALRSGLYAETLAPALDFGWSDLRAWREGRYKYIRAPRPELYDVAADPGEADDLAARQPDVLQKMASALERALDTFGDSAAHRALEPDAAERLRALGYAQGPGGRGSGADPKDVLEVAQRLARANGPFPSFDVAARVYAEIAALDPLNPLVNFRLADALLRSGRPRQAIAYYKKVVAGGPRTAEPFVGLATAYAELGRLDEARTVLEQALALDPGNGQAQYNLGEIALAEGDRGRARVRYRAALQDPVTRARAQARLDSLP